ncbi:ATP-binding protein [Zavarzinia sp. CC-PAN008]|uniref:sensor histidine kinase n=1 Tax=Zavarzinia sp. CC-PAN008 TaxID=3243332 RepID=UPI003F7420C4
MESDRTAQAGTAQTGTIQPPAERAKPAWLDRTLRLRALLVEVEPEDREAVERALRVGGWNPEVRAVSGAEALRRMLDRGDFDLVVADGRGGADDGMMVRAMVRERHASAPVIVLSDDATMRGLSDTHGSDLAEIEVPVDDLDRLSGAVARALDRAQRRTASGSQQVRLQAILAAVVDGILVFDIGGSIEAANAAAARLFGRPIRDLIGRNLSVLLQPPGPPGRSPAAIHEGDEMDRMLGMARELEGIRADGGRFAAEVIISEIPLEDSRRYTAVVRDVSERRAAQEELITARDEARRSNQAKSEFLANMSHELRTPLNAIIGFTEMLEGSFAGPLSPKQAEYVGDVLGSAKHLLSIINELLDLARIDTGAASLEESVIDPLNVVSGAARFLDYAMTEKRLAFSVASSAPVQLRCDERRMRQMVINLLSNAVKFTPSHGRIEARLNLKDDGALELSVADSGIGIAPTDIALALAPFGQISSPYSRQHQGTGLGLPLTRRLIEMHQGSLRIDSQAGRGTQVTLRFPPDRVVPVRPRT